ncbi:MAG: TonB family protein [Saprospiraceae bacterium]|jgi:protein TonB|nr:TonB family protein [Saprospiraceae bacterium]
MDVNNIKNAHIDDLVFENRNKSYGAYLLRRLYDKHMRNALLAGILLFLLIVAIPFVKSMIDDAITKMVDTNVEVNLEAPPSIDPNEPPPPPPPPPVEPPPPTKPVVKYTPPEIKKDEDVKEETPPPNQDELKDVKIGTQTIEGDKNAKEQVKDTPPPDERQKPEEKTKEDENKVFLRVEQMPEFGEGGATAQNVMKFIQKNVEYPTIARENNIQGTVPLKFVIERDGRVGEVIVLKDPGGGLADEAVRVIKKMPKWKPGKQQGKEVRVWFTVPVVFKLAQ